VEIQHGIFQAVTLSPGGIAAKPKSPFYDGSLYKNY
jgi:hypothetical protein